jgi:hypothetical protein
VSSLALKHTNIVVFSVIWCFLSRVVIFSMTLVINKFTNMFTSNVMDD